MRDPGCEPKPIPQADAVLSYEMQSQQATMEWVVWFLGLWIACHALVGFSWRATFDLVYNGWWIIRHAGTVSVTGALGGSILAGAAMMRRQRIGFYLAMLFALLWPLVDGWQFLRRGTPMSYLGVAPIVQAVVLLLVLASVLRRADAAGVPTPPRNGKVRVVRGDDLQFLVRRMGWIVAARGGIMLIETATWTFLLSSSIPKTWKLPITVQFCIHLAVMAYGLGMAVRRRGAIWLATATILLQGFVWPVVMLWVRGGLGQRFTTATGIELSFAAIACAATIILLTVLERKAAREPQP
jgi:hypothetical protein